MGEAKRKKNQPKTFSDCFHQTYWLPQFKKEFGKNTLPLLNDGFAATCSMNGLDSEKAYTFYSKSCLEWATNIQKKPEASSEFISQLHLCVDKYNKDSTFQNTWLKLPWRQFKGLTRDNGDPESLQDMKPYLTVENLEQVLKIFLTPTEENSFCGEAAFCFDTGLIVLTPFMIMLTKTFGDFFIVAFQYVLTASLLIYPDYAAQKKGPITTLSIF